MQKIVSKNVHVIQWLPQQDILCNIFVYEKKFFIVKMLSNYRYSQIEELNYALS